MSRNTQMPEGPARGNGAELDVHSIFYTIQGEGPFSGRPANFIRLAGCNIQCPGCDTEYTATRQRLSLVGIQERLTVPDLHRYICPLVVITGGEPFRQDIVPLVCTLIANRFTVQIETNGLLSPGIGFPSRVTVVCSPKARKVNEHLVRFISAYKYVLDRDCIDPTDGLPGSILGRDMAPARPPQGYAGPIFLTPMDMGAGQENHSQANLTAAAQSCMRHGYTFNLQVHKYANLP